MSTQEFRLKYTADVADLKKKLKDGQISYKQFQETVKQLQKNLTEAKKKAEESAKAMAGGLKATEAAGRALGGVLGEVTGVLGDLNDASEGLAEVLGEAGVAAGVAGVAFFGIGLAVAGAVSAVYELENGAIEAYDALVLPSEAKDEINGLRDQMGAASEATNRLSVEAGILAHAVGGPTVDAITGATLEMADLIKSSRDLAVGLWEVEKVTVRVSWAVMSLGLTELPALISSLDETARAEKTLTERGQELTAQMKEQREHAKQVHALEIKRAEAEKALADAEKGTADTEKEAAAAARDRAAAAREVDAGLKDEVKAHEDLIKLTKELHASQLDAKGKILQDYADEVAQIQSLAAQTGDWTRGTEALTLALEKRDKALAFNAMDQQLKSMDETVKATDRMMTQVIDNMKEGSEEIKKYTDAAFSVSSEVADSIEEVSGNLMSMTKEGSTAYRVLFAAQKAAAIAGITVDTAEGVASALTLPPPWGEIAAASRVAVGASQIATVVATSIGGGAQMPIGGVAPDHTGGIVAPGEGVLTRQTVARIGEQGVRDLNSGGGGGGGQTVVQLRYGPRALETVMVDTIARPGKARSGIRSLAGRRDAVAGHRG